MTLARREHLVQRKGPCDRIEIVMVEHAVRRVLDLLLALAQDGAVIAVGVARLGIGLQRRPRDADPLARIRDVPRLEQHDVPRQIAEAAARQGVVADIGDALRRQQGAEQGDDPLAHGIGHPGIDTVDDDVVEDADLGGEREDVGLLEDEVGERELRHSLVRLSDRIAAQVDAEEAAFRILRRHRDEVAAPSAAEFEHPHCRGRSRAHAVEMRDRAKARRMRLGEGVPRIGHRVIGIDRWIARHRRPPDTGADIAPDARMPRLIHLEERQRNACGTAPETGCRRA